LTRNLGIILKMIIPSETYRQSFLYNCTSYRSVSPVKRPYFPTSIAANLSYALHIGLSHLCHSLTIWNNIFTLLYLYPSISIFWTALISFKFHYFISKQFFYKNRLLFKISISYIFFKVLNNLNSLHKLCFKFG